MLVGDGMFVRVQLDLSVRVHEIALVKAGMMHVKKKKQPESSVTTGDCHF